MKQTTIEFEQRVDDRIQSLLARCDAVRRGSEVSRPTTFDAAGQRHAERVAAADAGGTDRGAT